MKKNGNGLKTEEYRGSKDTQVRRIKTILVKRGKEGKIKMNRRV